jgi:DNA-binding XRE family transcriptional regulator
MWNYDLKTALRQIEECMDKVEFKQFRKQLNKTQKEMAQLLGVSIKAIHSYEQGWRTVPGAVERQLLFLASRLKSNSRKKKACWTLKKCPPNQKKSCPAWEFNAGKFCWFINGTICSGTSHGSWKEKMNICRTCEVFRRHFNGHLPGESDIETS